MFSAKGNPVSIMSWSTKKASISTWIRDAHGDNMFLHEKLLRNYVPTDLEGVVLKAS